MYSNSRTVSEHITELERATAVANAVFPSDFSQVSGFLGVDHNA